MTLPGLAGLLDPITQHATHHTEATRDLHDRLPCLSHDPDNTLTELPITLLPLR